MKRQSHMRRNRIFTGLALMAAALALPAIKVKEKSPLDGACRAATGVDLVGAAARARGHDEKEQQGGGQESPHGPNSPPPPLGARERTPADGAGVEAAAAAGANSSAGTEARSAG